MQEQARVQELIETMEKASGVVAEKRRRHDLMYRSFLLAEGELSEACRAYMHARSQLEALAVAGLQKPSPARPASLGFLRDIGRAGHAGSPLIAAPAIRAPDPAPDPVPAPPLYQVPDLTPTELCTLRQAEAEDNAADAATDNIELALADNDPPAVQQEQYLQPDVVNPAPLAVPSRVAAAVRASNDPVRRVQSIVQALEAEQKAEAVPRIARKAAPWQSLSDAFTRPVLGLLAEANAPVPLATILARVRSLYTAETSQQYLRDMVASGYVQKVGKGFYAHKGWRTHIVSSEVAPPPRRGPQPKQA